MTIQNRRQKLGWSFVCILAIVLVIGVSWGIYRFRRPASSGINPSTSIKKGARSDRVEPEFLELTDDELKAMRLKTAHAVVPRFSRVLHLRGSLAINQNRLSHVHARFPGQIVELATTKGLPSQKGQTSLPAARPLQNFDSVEQGTPMAVIWSKDLGEKKTNFADSLLQLRTDKKTLDKFRNLTTNGGISDREYREQQLKVEQDENAAFSAEATLRQYQVTESDITEVKNAVEKIRLSQQLDTAYSSHWPRVDVTAPISGMIVEKNVTVGDIVDVNAILFKIADLSVLAVFLHPYEEDLPALEELPKPLKVNLKIPARAELGVLQAEMDRISPMIDPNEHMALLMGTIQNPKGALLAGQFVTAEVGIPAVEGVVEIPTRAVIDFGHDAIVFVQPDPSKPRFQRRRVRIVQRYFDVVHVSSVLSDEQKQEGVQEVHVGEAVVNGGVLELEDYLEKD